jgi:tetratricopeptide (TPR) repeat protein
MVGRRTWIGRIAIVGMLVVAAPGARAAMDEAPEAEREDRDLAKARKAIDKKDWDRAVKLLTEVAKRQGSNADVFNLLGYAERNRGNLQVALARYDEALRLDPRHRGAHEYKGEAWLRAGELAKAEEHLAALEKICGRSCHEYEDLARAIAEHRKKTTASR